MVRYRNEVKRTRITARVREYRSVKEKRIDLKNNESILLFEDVSDPPYSMNEFGFSVTIDFLAQIVDVDVDNVGEGVKGIVPDMIGDHGSGQHLVRVAHKIFQKAVFLGSEVDLLVLTPDLMGDRVETQVRETEFRAFIHLASTQERPDPGKQLCKSERLGQVIVRSGVKTCDDVLQGIL